MVHWGRAFHRYRRRMKMRSTLKIMFHLSVVVFVAFELLLKYFGPECLNFDCFALNITEIRIPVKWKVNASSAISTRVISATRTFPELNLNNMTGEERAILARSRCREVYGENLLSTPTNKEYPFENRVFLDHHEKLAYCAVAKAFSSNIKRVMLYLAKPNSYKSIKKLKTDISPINKIFYPHQLNFWPNSTVLKHFSSSEQSRLLDNYYSFVVVRDPILKAISAYRDKFFSKTDDKFHQYFRESTGKAICRAMAKYLKRSDANKYLKSAKVDCTKDPVYMDLQAFLAWSFLVPDQFRPHQHDNLNPHWALSVPICRICNPNVSYNFIGHFEKGLKDIYDIFDRANWDFPFPSVSDTSISEEEERTFTKEVESLPKEFMKELNNAVVSERYILGYTNERPEIIGRN